MKCAMELMELARQAEGLRIIEKNKRAEEMLLEAQKRKERTIEWCDTILSDYLARQAVLGNLNDKRFTDTWYSDLEMKFSSVSGSDMKIIEPLVQMSSKWDYADGKHSYQGNGKPLDTDTIVSYCQEHCIQVKIRRSDYKRYGWGLCYGAELSFKLIPACV